MTIADRRYRSKMAANDAEKKGLVADSMEVRGQLMEKMQKGELTIEEVQTQLKKIKRDAHKNGMYVRDDFYKEKLVNLELEVQKEKQKQLEKLNRKLNKNLNTKENKAKNKI